MLVSSSPNPVTQTYTFPQADFQKKTLSISEDDVIGEGVHSLVYEDDNIPGKVYKALKKDSPEGREKLFKECETFNKYYGAGAACIIESNDTLYLEMDQKTGVPFDEVDFFAQGAEEAFLDMLRQLEQKNIFPVGLKKSNVLYCYDTGRFYPVGLLDAHEKRLHASSEEAKKMNDAYRYTINHMLGDIASTMTEVVYIDTLPTLTKCIGAGSNGKVYLVDGEEGLVCKKFIKSWENTDQDLLKMAKSEASCFKRFYGADSAELFVCNGDIYLTMLKVPGKALTSYGQNELPKNAEAAYYQLLDELAQAKIMHSDLSSSNVCYDLESNRFYPIDMGNVYYHYFAASDASKQLTNQDQQYIHDELIDEIRARIPD